MMIPTLSTLSCLETAWTPSTSTPVKLFSRPSHLWPSIWPNPIRKKQSRSLLCKQQSIMHLWAKVGTSRKMNGPTRGKEDEAPS